MFRACRVTKRFEGTVALEEVSLSFEPGEVHALVGENGAGKSTLLKVLSGSYEPDAGHVEMNGAEVRFSSPRVASALGVYRVPQEPALMAELSVAENVFMGILPRRRFGAVVDWGAAREKTRDLLSGLGLEVDPRTPAYRLSIAEQQLVECARGLIRDCRVMLFDEPTSPLTQHEVKRLFEVIDTLRTKGYTLVFVSHRLGEVFALADRVTVLRDGRLVATRGRDECDRPQLLEDMIGKSLDEGELRPRGLAQSKQGGKPRCEVAGLSSSPRFEDVTFSVGGGEILGMAGLVGSGRTEIAETVFGLRPTSAGSVHIDGRLLRPSSPQAAIATGVVYVPEDRAKNGIFGPMSVTANVTAVTLARLRARLTRLLDVRGEERVAERVRQTLSIRAKDLSLPIETLSGGNQQKVVLGRWLELRPRVAIFDEPTRGIDARSKLDVYELLRTLAQDGVAVLVISSEVEELALIADRVLAVYEGKIAAEVTGPSLTAEAIGRLIVDPSAAVSV
ncbi:MAG TPA: sugar ABC transporter ATP-binding protein [Solirubrobacteraceae bacterium]|jgi:ABC-type sugar transport system ATPase subunit|nr:sugar ABC transporter ATP-binding protein [Solirubrobacteraceae bacterium]